MKEEIISRLEEVGLDIKDLTQDEIKQLENEIATEREGGMVLDGLLSPDKIMEIGMRNMK